jgi:hypothetical protein
MHKIYGFVLFIAGTGFLIFGAYLLYTEYGGSPLDWQRLLLAAGVCLFGYLLSITGYRMSSGERF